jgi:uncharacterized cupin superfamily protein
MSNLDVGIAELSDVPDVGWRSLRRELGLTAMGMSLMVFRPGQRWRIHRHKHQEEVYVVLSGELTIVVEADEHILRPRHAMRVGPGVRRQLINRGTEQVEFLAIGAAGEHESRDALAWTSWDEPGEGRPPQEVPLPDDLPS